MFEAVFGAEVPPALKFFLAFVLVLALIGATAWLVRRFGSERFGGSTTRGRQPRLAVVDAAAVDGRRRLVIVRRDNVEHLLMIGGPTDVVVESNIVRAMGAPRDRDAPAARAPAVSEPLTRPVPLEGTMWPLQPQPEVINQRPQRAIAAEETMQWTWQTQPEQQPSQAPRTDALTGLADELSERSAPQREAAQTTAKITPTPEPSRTPAPQKAATEPAPAAGGADQNLAEMAQRLEAALRRPNESRPPAEAPPKVESAAPRPITPEPKPARNEAKPSQPKALYDSLEQEMASLLGRPPGKT